MGGRLRGSSGGWIWCSQRLGVERLAFCPLPARGSLSQGCVRPWVDLARVQAARADQFSLAWFVVGLGYGACPACVGSYRFWSFFGLAEGGGRVSARRPKSFFASPKKRTQKKGDPAGCDPFALLRGNLDRGAGEVGRRTHFALFERFVRTTAASLSTKRLHPAVQPPPRQHPDPGASRREWGTTRAIAALGPRCWVPQDAMQWVVELDAT